MVSILVLNLLCDLMNYQTSSTLLLWIQNPYLSAWPTRPVGNTYRSNPFLASTLYTRPIKVPNLGSAFLVGANDLASDIPVLEDRFHPSQLIVSVIMKWQSRLTGSTKYPEHLGLTKIAGPAFGNALP